MQPRQGHGKGGTLTPYTWISHRLLDNAASPAGRRDNFRRQLADALERLHALESLFNQADADAVDFYAYELRSAQEAVSLVLRRARAAYGFGSSRPLASSQNRRPAGD